MILRMKLDPEGAVGGAASPEAPEPKFDAAALKNDIANDTRSMLNEAVNTMKIMIEESNNNKGVIVETPTVEFDSEYADDLAEIGIKDANQAKALLSIINKQLKKNAPSLQKEVLDSVEAKNAHQNLKNVNDQEVMRKYPDINDPKSELFKMASTIFTSMSKGIQNEPDAMAIAVQRAASKLKIQEAPTLEDIHGSDAVNSTRGEGGNGKPRKISSADLEFAKHFNVDPKAFEKRLLQISGR